MPQDTRAIIAACAASAARSLLGRARRRTKLLKQRGPRAEREWSRVEGALHGWWESLPPQDRHPEMLERLEGGGARYALRTARSFLTQNKLHDWVEKQNMRKGIAPCSRALLQQCTDATANLLFPGCSLPPKRKQGYQWLRRWRQRWGVRLRGVPTTEVLGAAEMQAKVANS